MLKRKTETEIKNWIRNGANALLVNGARQVGKTYLIRHCLQSLEQDYAEINLIDHPEAIPLLETATSAHELNVNLSLLFNRSLERGKTVLFIDEIQECKEFVTRVKFLVDEGDFRYILSGSLLGVELINLRSVPVGYLDEITMYPLDFEEFLTASAVARDVIDEMRRCYETRSQISDLIHKKMMEHFRRYLVVGGMPAAVQEYVDTGDIATVMKIQRNIIAQYKRDFTKYETKEKRLMLIAIYDAIPSELLRQNRRFNLADVKKGLRFERAESSFLWLKNAGVAIAAYNATEPRVSLSQNEKSSLLKLYLSDVGLLTCQYGKATKARLLANDASLNCGGIYENAIAQELHAHGYPLYYYNSRKQGELDFVIEHMGSALPIEVKSGKDYYVHTAVNNVTGNAAYDIPEAYVFADCNVSRKDAITYLPVYMSMFLNEEFDLPVLTPIG